MNRKPKQLLMLLTNIIIIVILSKCATSQAIGMSWANPDHIVTGTKHLVTNGSYFTSSASITYNITYSFPLSGTIAACAFSIEGFQSPPSINLSLFPYLASCNPNWFLIVTKAGGDTVLKYLQIFYIAHCSESTFFHIQTQCFDCVTLNSGNGTRSENRSITTLYGRYIIKAQAFISSFGITNINGVINTLYSSVLVQIGKSTFTVTFQTSQENIVNKICYMTVAYFDQLNKIEGYLNLIQFGVFELSNSRYPQYYNMPTIFRSFNRQFFGMSGFNMSRIIPRLFRMYFTDLYNLNTNYQTNIGTFDVKLSYIWVAKRLCDQAPNSTYDPLMAQCWNTDSCPTYTTITQPGHYCSLCHYSCNTCTDGNQDSCINCKSWRQRYLSGNSCPCNSGYVQVGIQQCYPCSFFLPGCQACSSSSICSVCSAGFTINSSFQCICSAGFQVSGYCTTIVGCTSALQFGGQIYCTSCNSSLFLQLNQQYFTCQCLSGYTMVGSSCTSICGDGILVGSQQCDDSNNIDGDGCSSSCLLEDGWSCASGSPSVCTYIVNPQLTVKYVKRISSGNIMRVAFQISPLLDKYSTLQFNSLISTNIPNSKFQSTYSNGLLIVDFDYNQTIQGKQYQVYLQLNQTYFNSSKISTTVKTTGMNTKLTYDSSYSHIGPLQIIVITLCAAALLIYFMTTFAEGMIGVQTILTIQTIFVSLVFIKSIPSMFSPLQQLRYSTGYNFISGDDPSRTYPYYFRLSALGIEKQFLLTYNLMFILMIIAMVICIITIIIFMVYKGRLKSSNTKKELSINKKKLKLVKQIKFIMIGKIFLLITMISMPTIWLALSAQMNSMNPQYHLVPSFLNYIGAVLAVFCIMALLLVMIADRILIPLSMFVSKTTSRNYPLIYSIFQYFFFLIIAFGYAYQIVFFVTIALSVLWGITIFIYRPYQQLFHNGALVYNQIVILISTSLYLFADYNSTNDNYQTLYLISCYLIIILILVVLIICLIRIFMECRCRKQSKEQQQEQEPILLKNQYKQPTKRTIQHTNIQDYLNKLDQQKNSKENETQENKQQQLNQRQYKHVDNLQYQQNIGKQQRVMGRIWKTTEMNKVQTSKRLDKERKRALELQLLEKKRQQEQKIAKAKQMSTLIEYIQN